MTAVAPVARSAFIKAVGEAKLCGEPAAAPRLDVCSFPALCRWLLKAGTTAAFYEERTEPDSCQVGRVAAVSSRSVTVDTVDTAGRPDGPFSIDFADLTRVDCLGGYELVRLGASRPITAASTLSPCGRGWARSDRARGRATLAGKTSTRRVTPSPARGERVRSPEFDAPQAVEPLHGAPRVPTLSGWPPGRGGQGRRAKRALTALSRRLPLSPGRRVMDQILSEDEHRRSLAMVPVRLAFWWALIVTASTALAAALYAARPLAPETLGFCSDLARRCVQIGVAVAYCQVLAQFAVAFFEGGRVRVSAAAAGVAATAVWPYACAVLAIAALGAGESRLTFLNGLVVAAVAAQLLVWCGAAALGWLNGHRG